MDNAAYLTVAVGLVAMAYLLPFETFVFVMIGILFVEITFYIGRGE